MGVFLGSVRDFRPATDANLSMVRAAIGAPADHFNVAALKARQDAYLTGFRFHTSPVVAAAVVTGRAQECCTNAGGIFVAHDVRARLRGAADLQRFIVGGHGYYGGEQCGEPYLYGLHTVTPTQPSNQETFDCVSGSVAAWLDPEESSRLSAFTVRLPATAGNTARVQGWLDASPPVYRLQPADSHVQGAQDLANAPWSMTLTAADAWTMATHHILFTVEDVTQSDGVTTVRISTPLYLDEYPHLPRFEFNLVFACGDSRLMERGSRWVAALVSLDERAEHAFLIPGSLLPEHAMTAQLGNTLAMYLHR